MARELPNPLPELCHPTDDHEGSCRSWFLGFSSVLVSRAATLSIVCIACKIKKAAARLP